MTPYLLIVDDAEDTPTSYAKFLRDRIYFERSGNVAVILIENVLIEHSLPLLRIAVHTKIGKSGYLAGIVVDLVEATNLRAGEDLLAQLRTDKEFSAVPVVIYTSKGVPIDPPSLLSKGATAVLLRDGTVSPKKFALQLLDAFKL